MTYRCFLAFIAPLVFVASASAGPILYVGSFQADLDNPDGPPSVSGSFSFLFDESTVDPIGSQGYELSLESFSMTATGATTFTTANVGILLGYLDGQFQYAVVGALVDGINLVRLEDDFAISFLVLPFAPPLDGAPAFYMSVSIAGTPRIVTFSRLPMVGSISSVPEPATYAMLGLGVLPVIALARRRAA